MTWVFSTFKFVQIAFVVALCYIERQVYLEQFPLSHNPYKGKRSARMGGAQHPTNQHPNAHYNYFQEKKLLSILNVQVNRQLQTLKLRSVHYNSASI